MDFSTISDEALLKMRDQAASNPLAGMSDEQLLALRAKTASGGGIVGAIAGAGRGAINSMLAGMQGTTPVTRDLKGNEAYRYIGPLVQSDIGPSVSPNPDGSGYERIDPNRHVVLLDEQSKPQVYERGDKTDTGRIVSLGHIAGPGLVTSPIAGASGLRVTTPAQSLAKDFERAGVEPNLPVLTQGRTSGTAANIINDMPIAGDLTTRTSMLRMREQTGESAARLAGQYGDKLDPAQAGRIAQEAATNYRKPMGEALSIADARARPSGEVGFGNKASALFGELDRMVPADAPVSMASTKAALEGLSNKFPSNPRFGGTLQNQLFARQLAALKDGRPLTYGELKTLRQYVGERLSGPSVTPDIAQTDWKRLYKGISEDMQGFAEAQGPEAARAFSQANRFFSAGMDRAENALQPVAKAASYEGAYNQIVNAASNGGGADILKAWQLKRSMPAEHWSQIGSAWIQRAGRAVDATGAETFNPAQFIKAYDKLSPQGKDLLFSGKGQGPQREMLDALARVSQAQGNLGKLNNPSRSGVYNAWMSGVAYPVWALLSGGNIVPAAATAGALGVATGAGKLLSSPAFARWFVNAKMTGPSTWPRHVAELENVATQEPGIRDALMQIQRSLSPADDDQGK